MKRQRHRRETAIDGKGSHRMCSPCPGQRARFLNRKIIAYSTGPPNRLNRLQKKTAAWAVFFKNHQRQPRCLTFSGANRRPHRRSRSI